MKRMKEFDNILNDCIDRVLSGESIEACLAAYPEHAAELEPLLRTALATRQAVNIEPRPAFRRQAGYDFQTAVRDMPVKKQFSFRRQIRLVTVLSVLMVVLLAGTGTVAAANTSLPDEPLYGVKLLTEDVRLAVTTSDLGKAELYAEFADKRVDEIIKMAEKGKEAQVVKATERMDKQLLAIASLSLKSNRGTPESNEILRDSAGTGPVSLSVNETPVRWQSNNVSGFAPGPVKSVTANVSRPGTDDKVKTNEKAELKDNVTRQAEDNKKDLEDALKNSPDSVKDAVKKAIDVAGKGYDEALKNIENTNNKNTNNSVTDNKTTSNKATVAAGKTSVSKTTVSHTATNKTTVSHTTMNKTTASKTTPGKTTVNKAADNKAAANQTAASNNTNTINR